MDSKSRKILLNTFWDKTGWKNGKISIEDQEYAIKQGAMFKPMEFSHTETLANIKLLCSEIKLSEVVSAFLYSLSTRKLEYRSTLGSYIYGVSIPEHKSTNSTYCNICGFRELEYHEYRRTWDVFNFERIKWGGVRHDHSSYTMFDLMQFRKLPNVTPIKEDIEIFSTIIKIAKELGKGGARNLEKAISKSIKSNKAEREVIIGILGICSILETDKNKGYLHKFTSLDYIDSPPIGRSNDWGYPVSWWNAQNGINEDALNEVFGAYIEYLS